MRWLLNFFVVSSLLWAGKTTQYLGSFKIFLKWPYGIIPYHITDEAKNFTALNIEAAFNEAINRWFKVCNVSFYESNNNGIKFQLANMQQKGWAGSFQFDSYEYNMNLGYHIPKTGTLKLNIQYLNKITTSDVNQVYKQNLLANIITHELGHALGFGHSDNPYSVMFANPYNDFTYLAKDDIAACQNLYGKKDNFRDLGDANYYQNAVTNSLREQAKLKLFPAGSSEFFSTNNIDVSNFGPFVRIFARLNYFNIPLDTVDIAVISPDMRLKYKQSLKLKYKNGWMNIPINSVATLKTLPGTWFVAILYNDQYLLKRYFTVRANFSYNKAPSLQIPKPRLVKHNDNYIITFNSKVQDPESDDTIVKIFAPRQNMKEVLVRNGELFQQSLTLQRLDDEFFVTLWDNNDRYEGTAGQGTEAGQGFRKVYRFVVKDLYQEILDKTPLLDLEKGWNMISSPIKDKASVIKLNQDVLKVYGFDNKKQQWLKLTNKINIITQSHQGLLIYSQLKQKLFVRAYNQNEVQTCSYDNLKQGFNFVANCSKQTQDIKTLLSNHKRFLQIYYFKDKVLKIYNRLSSLDDLKEQVKTQESFLVFIKDI